MTRSPKGREAGSRVRNKAIPGPATRAARAKPPPQAPVRIVAIGASAGGLDALEKFFGEMPASDRLAFVVVQHLDPAHDSHLADLLGRAAAMPVGEVAEGCEVEPGHVYVIPPGRSLSVSKNRLLLGVPVQAIRPANPIDAFLHSLADERGGSAIAIILSGTGEDGARGVRAVKQRGGLILVQEPETAAYAGMPRAAIATGDFDMVIAPEEMPRRLLARLRDGAADPEQEEIPGGMAEQVERLFPLLRAATGHDFSQYKRSPVIRRIQRRMAVLRATEIDSYMDRLRKDPAEARALLGELLIGVTGFFRDPGAFEALFDQVIGKLVAAAAPGGRLRIWVPGCATGEEAYSLAILLHEAIERQGANVRAQVFATDIDGVAIEAARAGIYAPGMVADLPAPYLGRYFVQLEHGYRVKPLIRDMLIFAEQNVTSDAPFSKLDLVSCRNLLIYLDTELQKKVVSTFHYALNPGGYLFLGSAESLGEAEDLFTVMDRKAKIFRSTGARRAAPAFDYRQRQPADLMPARPDRPRAGYQALAEAILLEKHTPLCVIVSRNGEVQYIHGHSGRYLEPPRGKASLRLEAMARPGLEMGLATALRRAAAEGKEVRIADLSFQVDGKRDLVTVTAGPLRQPEDPDGLLMVLFEPAQGPVPGAAPVGHSQGEAVEIALLERELQEKQAYLQTIIKELETANEEMNSANEELQSSNEELQSTNEEHETAKEELQSTNEELITVNAELEAKIIDLDKTQSDMSNLLSSIDIGVIFLDMDLRITRYTPAATRVANLMVRDIGRPLSHVVFNLQSADLVAAAVQVLDTLVPFETQVQSADAASWYALRMVPYRSNSNLIDGVVLTVTDLTRLKKLEDEARLATVVRDSNDAVTIQDRSGRILAWNPRAEAIYGYSETEALSLGTSDMMSEAEQARCQQYYDAIFSGRSVPAFRTARTGKDGQIFDILITASALINKFGVIYAISTTEKLLE